MHEYRRGADSVGDELYSVLEPEMRKTIIGFLGSQDADIDDLMQDSFLALCQYLQNGGQIPDNPISFATTIIRNRCRNLYRWRKVRPHENLDDMQHWYASGSRSPLDLLVTDETLNLIQEGLDSLGAACSELLRSIYLEHCTMDQMKDQLKLTSVQAVYYRRNQCLGSLKKFFNNLGPSCPDLVKTSSHRISENKGTKDAK